MNVSEIHTRDRITILPWKAVADRRIRKDMAQQVVVASDTQVSNRRLGSPVKPRESFGRSCARTDNTPEQTGMQIDGGWTNR